MYEAKKNSGNYVSINVKSIDLPDGCVPKSGTIVPDDKLHVTLIYSEDSNMPMKEVSAILKDFPKTVDAIGKEFAVFDNPDKGDTVALVLKISSDTLSDMSNAMLGSGLKHSYDKIDHHVTVAYGVDKGEATSIMDKMNSKLQKIGVVLSGLNVDPIIEDWAETL